MQTILVINAGSSSVKYQLIEVGSEARIASGVVERIGEKTSTLLHQGWGSEISKQLPVADHHSAFVELSRAFAEQGHALETIGVVAVGHRVVQGGSEFVQPTLIDDGVAERIMQLSVLAPLHNPGHYKAITAAREVFSAVPHVAVFDTAFHQSMPDAAYTYALPPALAEKYGVRRYGFHGISYQIVSQRAAAVMQRPVSKLKQIILHLGNGASACAIDGGCSVNTSMGLTPLEGLVMGTRSGDIDPGAMLHLLRAGVDTAELDDALNKHSGLLGMAGSNDMRDVRQAAEAGDAAAQLALDVYTRRIRHYVGAYLLELGGADTIVFTAGVGENSWQLRRDVCAGLQWFGIELDQELNAGVGREARVISTPDSRVTVLVVPTDEEAEIARQTALLINVSGQR